jgi:hypothetical protein
MAAAAVMPGAANAAVVVLGFTIGTWALDFFAAGRGGFVQKIAAFTPTATLRNFERGLLRIDVVLVMLLFTLIGLLITATWLRLGRTLRTRILATIGCAALALLAVLAPKTSFDFSENRRSSFALAEERMLRGIDAPLTLTVFLAAEDPRMADLESNVLVKLRRSMRHVDVRYPLEGRSGLFENDDRYGEIVYDLDGKRDVNRSTTEAIVIETIAKLAGKGVPPPEDSSYAGYPLAKAPAGAAWIFYALWPCVVIAAWIMARWWSPRSRRTG